MTDEPLDDEVPEGPRRKTFEPLSDDVVFTGAIPVVDDAPDDAPADEPASIPDPPVRTSLAESAILEKFGDPHAGSTADLMAELEQQVALKEQEEQAFADWENTVRHVLGDEAESLIARERIIFDGGDPGPLESEEPEESIVEEPEPAPADESETEGDAEDEPLDDEESLSVERDDTSDEVQPQLDEVPASAPTPHLAQSTIGALGSWWGVAVPIAAILAGGYLSFRGLGILESVVVLGVVVVVTSAMVGVLSHQGFRRGHATQDLLRGSFGKRGALIPAIVVAVIQIGLASALLWWASDVLVDIVGGAGLWPYERWIGAAGSWGLLVGVVAALTLVSSRVLHAALIAGSLASLAALVILLVLGLPNVESTLDWSWNAGWMTVVSALSVLLSLAVSVTVFVAADLATLGKSAPARAGGVVSALALALPALALAGVASWMAQSSPLVSLGLFADPVGTLTEGAPAYYPSIAAFVAVVPLVAVVSLLTRSASAVVPSIPFPGPWRVHAAVILGVVAVVGSLALVFNLQLIDVLSDLALSVGVVASALAAILAKEWAVVGTTRRPEGSSVRALPLGVLLVSVAVGLGLLDSDVSWLSWQGYLFPALDAAGVMDLSPAQPGVLVSFALAALVSGIGALVERSRVRKNSDVEVD